MANVSEETISDFLAYKGEGEEMYFQTSTILLL